MNDMATSKYTGSAVQIALIYFAFGFLWIAFSDTVLNKLVQDIDAIARVQMYKGWVFILLTSALVFFLIKQQESRRQQVEQTLRKSRGEYREASREVQMIIDNIPAFIMYKNDKNVLLRVNKAIADVVGTTAEAMNRKPTELYFPQLAEKLHQDDMEVIRTGQPKLGIVQKIPSSSNTGKKWLEANIRWIKIDRVPIFTEGGKATEILVVLTDITERKEAEEKLQQQQALLEAIINDIPDALMMVDLDRRIFMSNPGASRIFGYSANEITGKSTELFYRDKEEFRRQGKQRFNRKADVILTPYIVNYRRKNGEIFPGESIGAIIKDPDGQPVGYLSLIRDVSDRMAKEQEARDLQERLAHVGRLSTMSEMTAGIAHEINQPLTAIANYAQASRKLLDSDPASPKLAGALQKISEQAIRAGDIIRKLRDFIKQRESRHERVNCDEMIRQVVQLAEIDTRVNNIPIVLELSEHLPVVSVDPVQIQQVILNLVRNGMDAILTVSSPQPKILISSIIDSNNKILIAVEDNGAGITENIAANIFDPFVSTKATGMGMGLSISRTIIRSHGGELNYKPLPSGGSRFYFTLPAITGE